MHSKRVRHSLKLAARVGRPYSFVSKIFLNLLLLVLVPLEYLHRQVIYAYSFITPPCFYSPGNEFHISLDDELEAITLSLEHKQKKLIQQRQNRRFKLLLISFALLLLAFKHHHHDAHAGDNSTNLGISATVTAKCKIYSATMAFGTYDPHLNSNLDVDGNLMLSCTKNTTATISMNAGANTSRAQGTTRSMLNTAGGNGNSSYMSYELYKNAARTSVWSTSSPLNMTATSAGQVAVPIYGRIPQGQNVQDGGYVDTVVVTVNF